MTPAATSSKEIETQAAIRRAARLKRAREWHLYLGTLFAPSILFFALTGALQLFGLHESHPGETYQAPVWVQKLGSIHKDQVLERHGPTPGAFAERKAPPSADAAPKPAEPQRPKRGGEERRPSPLTYALKFFFLAMSLGLVSSTVLGIFMAFKYNRSRTLVWGLLVAGTVIPLGLILATA